MNDFSLAGKQILISGASSGIGRQVAISVSQLGGKCIITGRNSQRLQETFDLLEGSEHKSIVADLTENKQIESLVDELPELNGMVHSAGITTHMPAKFIRPEDISQIFKINFDSIVLLNSRILKKKKLTDNSSIVILSSSATRFMYFGGALYSSTKSALVSYTKVLALELAPRKVRANCLSPSFVKTPMVEGAGQTISQEVLERFEKMSPLGFGDPKDVANAVIFYLSDASRWITGTDLIMGAIF